MALFRITAKEKHGNMPAGTTLTVDTGGTTSCDPDKIKIAIKNAGYDSRAQEATYQGYYIVERIK